MTRKDFDQTDIIDIKAIRAELSKLDKKAPSLRILLGEKMGKVFQIEDQQVLTVGRDAENDICLDIAGFSRRHCCIRRNGNQVTLEDLKSTNGTFVNGEKCSRKILKDGDRIFLGEICALKFSYFDKIDLDINKMLFKKATQDVLTGANNRTYFQENFRKEFLFHKRSDLPLSLILFDFDDFKQVNDTYGHVCGDIVLKEAADIVFSKIREIDFFARYGGEEFVVLLKNTPFEDAMILAEKLRAALSDAEIMFKDKKLSISASFGVTTLRDMNYRTPEEMFVVADETMFLVKEKGKNGVLGDEKS